MVAPISGDFIKVTSATKVQYMAIIWVAEYDDSMVFTEPSNTAAEITELNVFDVKRLLYTKR